jgi:predicted RNA-binding protein YlxR (DUF448 family)
MNPKRKRDRGLRQMANKKIPMRQCIGCHEMKAKKEMIRVIKTQEKEGGPCEILLDTTGRKNGRGAYLCPSGECLRAAIKNKGLERSFKMPIPKEVYEMLTKEMEEFET